MSIDQDPTRLRTKDSEHVLFAGRILDRLGLSRDDVIDYYHNEDNATPRQRSAYGVFIGACVVALDCAPGEVDHLPFDQIVDELSADHVPLDLRRELQATMDN